MEDADKVAFTRALATLRAMYPNEFNFSELLPVAYWVACRSASLESVKAAMLQLVRCSEWHRQMPPAPVLAELARVLDRRQALRYDRAVDSAPEVELSADARAWVEAAKDLTDLHVKTGLDRGHASARAIHELLERPNPSLDRE